MRVAVQDQSGETRDTGGLLAYRQPDDMGWVPDQRSTHPGAELDLGRGRISSEQRSDDERAHRNELKPTGADWFSSGFHRLTPKERV
jgi:hypothetical protein